MIHIVTKRLILRNFQPEDVEDYFEYMSLPYTAAHENFDPLTYEKCKELVEKRQERDDFWAVELRKEGKLIGDLCYTPLQYGAYEIGYDFNVRFEKHGYATEACAALVRYIFTTLGGRRITAECNEENDNSWRLLERLGFRREGHFMQDVAFKYDEDDNPIYVNSYAYGLLQAEWKALQEDGWPRR